VIHAFALSCILSTIPLAAAGTVTVQGGANVPVTDATFLSIDYQSVPFRRNLELTMVQATKHPDPVLRRGPKNSFDELRAEYYGTVIRVDGKFRMWYCGYGFAQASNRTLSGVDANIGYAESIDGVVWAKPNLGLKDFQGSKNNNIVLIEPNDYTTSYPDRNIHILHEPDDPDPTRRYKMMMYVPHDGDRDTMIPLFSADGLHWRYARKMELADPEKAKFARNVYQKQGTIPRFTIASTGMPNEHLEGGGLVRVGGLYYFNGQSLNGHDGRNVARFPATYISADFVNWNHEKAVSMTRWGYDGMAAVSGGPEVHEGVALWNRGNVLVGVFGLWEGAKNWADRRVHLGIVTTVDAINFREPKPNFVFAEAGKSGSWDANGLLQGQGFANVGDETFIWYGSWDLTASGATPTVQEQDMVRSHGDIGLLRMRRDGFGFIGIPDPATIKPRETFATGLGSLLTVPFRIEGTSASVFVNAEAVLGGKIRVEVLDEQCVPVPGFSLTDAIAVENSGMRVPVRWKGERVLPPSMYRLRVQIERGASATPRLYAIYVTASTHDVTSAKVSRLKISPPIAAPRLQSATARSDSSQR